MTRWSDARPRRRACTHLTAKEHIAGVDAKGRPVWSCTHCGARGTWQAGWQYYGTFECRHCGQAEIDSVRCPKCPPNAGAQPA